MAGIGLGDYQEAGEHFDHAVELRPLYEFDLVGVREAAWIDQYQAATPYVQSGDYETAATYFENAAAIYDGRPEANITLGQIYAQLRDHDRAIENMDAAMAFMETDAVAQMDSATIASWEEQTAELPLLRAQVLADAGRFDEAVGTYRQMSAADPTNMDLKRGLAQILTEMGNETEATAIYDEMLTMDGLSAQDLFIIGVGFYQSSDYDRAVDAFSAAAGVSVNDRDAIELWARSLQLAESFDELPAIAERWIDLDPNGGNAYLMLAQAANQAGDSETTQMAIQTLDGLDVTVDNLQMQRIGNGGARVSGSVTNKKLSAGASVSIRFTFYSDNGSPIGSVTESVSVADTDVAQDFELQFDSAEQVGGYGYEVVG